MGHEEEARKMTRTLREIFQTDCLVLDIGDRHGSTSYIDFIKPDELLDTSIMKGVDHYRRPFIVFKSEVRVNDTTVRLFTTFFQRYAAQSEDEVLYHTAGHYGTQMFDTTGGTCLMQMECLREFLKAGFIELSIEQMKRFRIRYRDYSEIELLDPNTVDTITLGWAESP